MGSARVLVADDDADVRALVCESLTADGMTVRQATNGIELLSVLSEGGVDLIVTDVMMPDLGGVQAAARARTTGVEIPILVMTACVDSWVADSVSKLQRSDVLYKPFSGDELIAHAHALLEPDDLPAARPEGAERRLFPPALVPLLRKRAAPASIVDIGDEVLRELLSVVFFAGLEREEGERNSVRVVFIGQSSAHTESPTDGLPPALYRWSTRRFTTPRELTATHLVKLAAATIGSRVFIEVCYEHGRLVITGLSREGVNIEGDRALKVVVQRPGGLSIRVGHRHIVDYAHGCVQALAANVVLASGPVRDALVLAATGCQVPPRGIERYLEVVDLLVARLAAHGSGGILVFSAELQPTPEGETGYRTSPDLSLAAIVRRLSDVEPGAGIVQQDQLLVGALQAELEHAIDELGALTALDGATILDRSLALVGFGIVLPVDTNRVPIFEAEDVGATEVREFDLGGRGTRHRAAAAYAWHHPSSVVFVASEDGSCSCFFRAALSPRLLLWRLGGG